MKSTLKNLLRPGVKKIKWIMNRYNPIAMRRELDTLYTTLYHMVHNEKKALDLAALQTEGAFSTQWNQLKSGNALLTDPWFKDNVTRILAEEEMLIKPEWFQGKDVLDAGCGNGRWSYGLVKLGANVTAVDVNESALNATKKVLSEFDVKKEFYLSPIEDLKEVFKERKFDLVFSWGVIHHCKSYSKCLENLCHLVKPNGVLYLYLYGRESMNLQEDVELFKERIRYNSLLDWDSKYQFLLKKAGFDPDKVHNVHDVFAPLINRRLEFAAVKEQLETLGFEDVTRTISHSEVFVRAIRGDAEQFKSQWALQPKASPYWFERY